MTDQNKADEQKLSDRLRVTADELDALDPCGWDEAWTRTCNALSRGNPEWSRSGRAPTDCMEAELARLYDIEKKCADVEHRLRVCQKGKDR